MSISIFDQYGIKEVADVVLYNVETKTPELYIDSLKVSNIEQTSSQSDAKGGKGNAKLITWDYGKEISLTLTDALVSMKSLAILMGGSGVAHATAKKIRKAEMVTLDANKEFTLKYDASNTPYILEASAAAVAGTVNTNGWKYAAGVVGDIYRVAYEVDSVAGGAYEIIITPNTFPGTYTLVGDTVIRNKYGADEGFQFIVPKCKVSSEVTLTMEAEGDPSTFDMKLTVLKSDNGTMMSLVKYDIGDVVAEGTNSNLY